LAQKYTLTTKNSVNNNHNKLKSNIDKKTSNKLHGSFQNQFSDKTIQPSKISNSVKNDYLNNSKNTLSKSKKSNDNLVTKR